jgi:hypothetical protein
LLYYRYERGGLSKRLLQIIREAPLDVLEEYEGNILAALDDYKTIGDKNEVEALKVDLKRVRKLMDNKKTT